MLTLLVRGWECYDDTTDPTNQFNWIHGDTSGQSWWEPKPAGATRMWACTVYANNDSEFIDWMNANCLTASRTHRFNSGSPMWSVEFSSEQEAAWFKLTWM